MNWQKIEQVIAVASIMLLVLIGLFVLYTQLNKLSAEDLWNRPEVNVRNQTVKRGDELMFSVEVTNTIADARIKRDYLCSGVVYPIDLVFAETVNAPMVVPPRVPSGSVCKLELTVRFASDGGVIEDTSISEGTFTAE